MEARRSPEAIMDHRDFDLASLKHFNLSCLIGKYMFNCSIESLSADAFDDLPNLSSMEIQVAPVTFSLFDFTSIEKLRQLNKLLIQNCTLEKSEFEIKFDSLENLTDISLTNFNIDLNKFSCLKSLKLLSFNKCKLGNLTSKNFSEMAGLFFLALNNCGLEVLEADLFDHLANLRTLTLSFNRLSTLHKDIFKKLGCLKDLNLMLNQLNELDASIFKENKQLQQLYLSK